MVSTVSKAYLGNTPIGTLYKGSLIASKPAWTLADTTTLAFYNMLSGITDAGSGKVSAWADFLGTSARNVAQATGANRPTLTADGVVFNGTSEFLFNSNPFMYALAGGYHVICIMSAPATTIGVTQDGFSEASTLSANQHNRILCKDTTTGQTGLSTQSIRNDANVTIATYGGNTGTTVAWDNTFKMIEYTDTTIELKTAINCVNESSPIPTTRSGTMTLNRYGMGALVRVSILNYMAMTLKCKAVFPANISLSDRQKAQGYLAHLYGQAALLPVDHPYKNAPPTV